VNVDPGAMLMDDLGEFLIHQVLHLPIA
jgi:hypothetical protein